MILLIPEHNRMGFMLGIPGLVLQTGASFLAPMFQPVLGDNAGILTSILQLCGMALVITGLAYVAMAKGYHWALGFLGIFSCIGLIIIAVLPDKNPGPVPYYGSFGQGGAPPPGGPGWGPGPQGYTPPAPQNPYAAPNQGWGQPPQQGGPGAPPGGQGPQGGGWGSGGWGGPPPA